MCGILGIVEKHRDNTELVDSMLNVLAHRGPDGKSVFQHEDVIIGHRRLSIIDLMTGDQPIYNHDRTKCILFNGEIYNYRELRDELIAKGCEFATQSDTEVVLKAYEIYGPDSLTKLNGLFAFVIYDKRKRQLFLARDHFGIKPLHYYYKDGLFIFGSEQKVILQHPAVPRSLNKNALHQQINLRYTQGDETLFEGIKRLAAGHYMIYKDGQLNIERYWNLLPNVDFSMTEEVAIERFHFYMKQAVRRQLVSDVPIGVYLSGGLDSSTIVQKMHELEVPEINSFTVGFNEPTDEFNDARLVADQFQTNHREMSLALNPLKEMKEAIWHAEEPKINLIQGYKLSRFVRPHVKVVLGGLGGDELFAGYDIHKFIYPTNRLHNRIPSFLKRLLRWKSDFLFKVQNGTGALRWDEYRRGIQMLLAIGNIERFYLILRNVWDFDQPFYNTIYSKEFNLKIKTEIPEVVTYFKDIFEKVKESSALDQVLFADFNSKMINDYLLKEDRMSMAHSVEERVPFLDLDLVKFGFSIPLGIKMKGNQSKYLFRKAMKGYLPSRIISKKKWGFTVNPYLHFKKDLRQEVERQITRSYIEKQGIFNYGYIRKILDYPPHPRLRWHYNFLWIILGLKIWEETFLSSEIKTPNTILESYQNA